ncbi:adenylyl-sulfate kinase [Pseudomonas sp. PIC25]|uniref:adenylyl-sulfate kinase n=1 Tax=Pseudomonas sp. PIC25 TaxID=1958773 RepID=UPI000BDC9893|nr:adenylyl-sulfate kinase [Pseudomonas sp. PIC25]PAU60670.1 adenylyl-sulfate kinase [Pseudomonas sp. PIC25]
MDRNNDNIVWQATQVSPQERALLLGQRPVTLWLTGLSGSGKSTLAFALERQLVQQGNPCFVLDGDNIRHGLNRDLGFTPDARAENIRRIAEVAKLMNMAGLIVIASFISPYRQDRQMAREIVGADAFREIHLSTALERCEERDPKGLYRKARAGLIPGFTGISAPYEPPTLPDLRLDTAALTVDDCLEHLMKMIRGFLT